jgi:hypothetical protein
VGRFHSAKWQAEAVLKPTQSEDGQLFLDFLEDDSMQFVYGVRPIQRIFVSGEGTRRGALSNLLVQALQQQYDRLWDAIGAIVPAQISDTENFGERVVVKPSAAAKERSYFQLAEVHRQAAATDQQEKADERFNERLVVEASERFKQLWERWEPHFELEPTEHFGDRIVKGPQDIRVLKKIGVPEGWDLRVSKDGIRVSSQDPSLSFGSYRGKRPTQIRDVASMVRNAAMKTPAELLESANNRSAYGDMRLRKTASQFYDPGSYRTPFGN